MELENLEMDPEVVIISGRNFDLIHPERSEFDIHDIAHGLSNICRFNGHTKSFYSVAQHSVIVASLCHSAPMAGLLHDAAEAFLGDISTPLKQLLPAYKELEKNIMAVIYKKFGLTYPEPVEVKQADLIALATENRDLMPDHDAEWGIIKDVEPAEGKIFPFMPETAEIYFLEMFENLTRQDQIKKQALDSWGGLAK